MRRTALVLAPVFALALVAGCDQVTNNGSGSGTNAGQGGGGSGPCIVGSWTADAKDVLGTGGSDSSDAAVDGTLEYTFTTTDFTMKMDMTQGSDSFSGEATGTYRTDGNNLTMTPTGGSITQDGKTTQTQKSDLNPTSWTFDCSGSALTITLESGSTSSADEGDLGLTGMTFTRK